MTTKSDIQTISAASQQESVIAADEQQPKKPGGRWLKRLLATCIVLAIALAAGVTYLAYSMRQWDIQHTAFLDSGRSINEFLKAYASDVNTSHERSDPSLVCRHYSPTYSSPGRGIWSLGDGEDIGDVEYYELQSIEARDYEAADIRQELASYLSGIATIDRTKCKINLIEEMVPNKTARLTVNYVLDGRDPQGRLFQDRFRIRWWLDRATGSAGTDGWKIVRDELVHGVRNAGHGRGFVPLSPSESGIDYVHRRNPKLNPLDPEISLKFAVIEHAAGGVAAADYDGDELVDVFFADGVESKLYRNVGPTESSPVAFTDATTAAGLSGIDQAHCGLFADFDNDGDKDLFVTRYLAACKIYCNNGDGTFVDSSEAFGLDFAGPSVSACLLDYDADGYLDVYIAVNGNAFESCPNVPFYAMNGQPCCLLRNVEGKRFLDVTETSGTGNEGWTLAVTAGDYNADGRPDLLLANDFGRKVLYRNNGDGTFTDVTKEARILDFSGGMGVAFGDFNDDGAPDVYTANINSNQRWFGEDLTIKQYMNNIVRTKWIWDDLPVYREIYKLLGNEWTELGQMVGEGNSLFANNGDGTFRELKESRTRRAGWGWAVGFFDADNDADLDLFATNGWISGEQKDDL